MPVARCQEPDGSLQVTLGQIDFHEFCTYVMGDAMGESVPATPAPAPARPPPRQGSLGKSQGKRHVDVRQARDIIRQRMMVALVHC